MSNLAREYKEKRDFIRMQIETPATLQLENGNEYSVICMDLSSSGAQLQSTQAIPNNSVGKLSICSGGGSTSNLDVEVTVCRVQMSEENNYQVGVLINRYL